MNADRSRRYGVFIYDGCNADRQEFPTPSDMSFASCNNDDARFPSAKFSLCPTFPAGTVPAGMPFDAGCMALAETAVSLNATLAHDPADTTNTYTVGTSLAQDFAARLSDATCSDVLDWGVTGWEITWPDGQVDTRPASGKQGTVDSRQLAAGQSPDPATTRVLVRAHVHITAQAVDFDAGAHPVVRTLSADVVLSNDPAATGGGAPVYTPPTVTAAAMCTTQLGDGTIPQYDPTLTLRTACDTIRGRLEELYPWAVIASPGEELVGGVAVGEARSVYTGWTYLGGVTDTPARETTWPGTGGRPTDPIDVQYNHVARMNHQTEQAIPEQVPYRVTVQTTYPDGHQLTEQVTGSVAITIYYVGINFEP